MLATILNKIRPGAEWVLLGDKLEWLDQEQTKPTAEEIEAGRLLVDADIAKSDLKKNGKDYNGTVVSFTKDDGDALVQVKNAFEMGLTDTIIHFDNGSKLPMNVLDFPDFALWFVNERNKFFLGV